MRCMKFLDNAAWYEIYENRQKGWPLFMEKRPAFLFAGPTAANDSGEKLKDDASRRGTTGITEGEAEQ